MRPPARVAAILVAVAAVLVAVYLLKVWHAQGICAELGGLWQQDGWVGECHFIEKSGRWPAPMLNSLVLNS